MPHTQQSFIEAFKKAIDQCDVQTIIDLHNEYPHLAFDQEGKALSLITFRPLEWAIFIKKRNLSVIRALITVGYHVTSHAMQITMNTIYDSRPNKIDPLLSDIFLEFIAHPTYNVKSPLKTLKDLNWLKNISRKPF